jgi:hypothetical protein
LGGSQGGHADVEEGSGLLGLFCIIAALYRCGLGCGANGVFWIVVCEVEGSVLLLMKREFACISSCWFSKMLSGCSFYHRTPSGVTLFYAAVNALLEDVDVTYHSFGLFHAVSLSATTDLNQFDVSSLDFCFRAIVLFDRSIL